MCGDGGLEGIGDGGISVLAGGGLLMALCWARSWVSEGLFSK